MPIALDNLAHACGIQTQYHRIGGELCTARPEIVVTVLKALGCPIVRAEDAGDVLRQLHEDRQPPAQESAGPAPQKAFADPVKKWGVFLPLYAARSHSNWGAGDFSDLARLAEWTGRQGGHIFGTLPLLPVHRETGHVPSPYAPCTRLFWNPFYIDCTAVPELAHCPAARELAASPGFQDAIATCRSAARVEYHAVMALKEQILHLLAETFFKTRSGRRRQFEEYVASHPDLVSYCDFLAADSSHVPWRDWLPILLGQRPSASRYHQYAHWIADEQMTQASDNSRAHGVRLYLDFPLGVHPDGYDSLHYKDLFVPGIHVGAPPDPFFANGQDWGFQPLHPRRLYDGGLDYWARCLRHHMHRAGVLRLDHVMGLHRQFWIPEGFTARDGVYVRYPAEAFYAILCRESQIHRTIVIGEDLGTVPDGVRTAMYAHGLLRMHILQFDPASEHTTAIPKDCLTALNTHDMPPFAAHWGMRPATREALQRHLDRLFRSPAETCMVNLEDLWLETAPQNRPGTVSATNWSHKARYFLEDFDGQPDIRDTLQQLDRLRQGDM